MGFGLDPALHRKLALELFEAERDRKSVEKISRRYPDINVEDSYAIQQIGLRLRLEYGWGSVAGRKIGLTSKGMMQQLNATDPDYGYLLDSMLIPEGSPCKTGELIQPRVEGELAFLMGKPLKGPGVTVADIYRAAEWIVPCFEIIDTRIENYDVTVRDTIADNAGTGRYMIGSAPRRLTDRDPRLLGMAVEKNGELWGSAAGVEVMGNPVNSMVWLVNRLAQFDTGLEAGDIVLSGAFMAAIPADAGDVFTLSVDGFPSVNLRFL